MLGRTSASPIWVFDMVDTSIILPQAFKIKKAIACILRVSAIYDTYTCQSPSTIESSLPVLEERAVYLTHANDIHLLLVYYEFTTSVTFYKFYKEWLVLKIFLLRKAQL